MTFHTFTKQVKLPVPVAEAFAWHERPGAFERMTPPWAPLRLVDHQGIENGARARIGVRFGPVEKIWVAEHRNFQRPHSFEDVQITGPFASWKHTHTMSADGDDACRLEDRIEFELPAGRLGSLLASRRIEQELERAFTYRHRTLIDDLQAHRRAGSMKTMKILVTGSTGLVGSELVPLLTTGGHDVYRLVRAEPKDDHEVRWNPSGGDIDATALEGLDGVVHLAGENIAGGRWTDEKKRRIRASRVEGTGLLSQALARLDRPPRVMVCASAVGYYGDRGNQELDEASEPGTGFLPEVCREWEAAADPARERGIRVVNVRIGVVLSPKGGALKQMLTPFKLGGGGVIGSGKQYWSWVAIDDLIGIIEHALTNEELAGPVNATSPNPATNREFTKTLGKVLNRPTILPMPAFAARLALGEMADDLLLASARVLPRRLQESSYVFRFPELEGALRHLLGRHG